MTFPKKNSASVVLLTLAIASGVSAVQMTLRTRVSLVTIPVHVTTELGLPITNLMKEDFQLFEDNVQQKIVSFTKQDAPLSIGFLLDSSGSMRRRMRTASEAATAFCKTANPEDEFFLIHFGDKPKLDVPFTNDTGELFRYIARARASGRTSLLDAIHLSLAEMKRAKNARKAIVILSDGGDNCSRHTEGQIRNAMSETDVQLYAMGIFDPEPDPKKQPLEEQNGPDLLSALAEMTGGRHYPVSNIGELPSLSERIGIELRNEYVLGYISTNTTLDGKYRTVKLTVGGGPTELPPVRTQYRRGYRAPME